MIVKNQSEFVSYFLFSSCSSELIMLTHLGKFPLHRNVVSGKSGSGWFAFIIEMLISQEFKNSRHSRNSRGNGCKLSGQRLLGWFGQASVGSDWSMVSKGNKKLIVAYVVHLSDPRSCCASSL